MNKIEINIDLSLPFFITGLILLFFGLKYGNDFYIVGGLIALPWGVIGMINQYLSTKYKIKKRVIDF